MKARFMILALALGACAGAPGPGDAGYEYNLNGSYVGDVSADDGSFFAATFELETLPGGSVVGTMSITDPIAIVGDVTGTIIGAEAALDMTYEISDQNCGGSFTGSAVIDAGGDSAAGSLDVVEDSCGGGPTAITVTLGR